VKINPGLFPDVADALGIGSPAIVEKDVYAVHLLSQISQLSSEAFELVFSGGTSLAKSHRNMFRMSEDIDIKLVAREEMTAGMSRTALRAARKEVLIQLEKIIGFSEHLQLDPAAGVVKRNEYRFAEFTIQYPRSQRSVAALRPNLKLDVTASELFEPFVACSVSSLYAEILQLPPEVPSFPVVGLNSTICEKLVALLRRTAHFNRDPSRKDDKTLVRHAYDLHMLASAGYAENTLRNLISEVVRVDVTQFGRQHTQFLSNPFTELRYGLTCLFTNPIHRKRYEFFIGPLVYHENPATWDEALKTVAELAQKLLPVE